MAQTNTSVFINLYVAGLLFWLPFCIVSLLRAVSLLTLGMGWTLTCGHQAWPRGHQCNPCTAHLLFWQPFFIAQQEELFFQGNEQTGWWSSSSHYIMFLRTSTLQREEKKCLFSRPILLGRQTVSILVYTEACCSYLLTEPPPKPPCHGHSLCSSRKMASLVGQFGMSFLLAHSFRRLKKCDISGLWFCVQQLHFKCSLE